MTLKEKLNEKLSESFANEIEQIADEFAIGFAQWFICYYTEEAFYEKNYIKEMLETYKKEKGL